MLRRKKPIPPPLQVTMPQPPTELALPFMLVDYPRVLLDYLSKSPSVPEAVRQQIAELTLSYSSTLAEWIMDEYGFGGLMKANILTQQVAAEFYKAVGVAQQESESSLFNFLEKDINGD